MRQMGVRVAWAIVGVVVVVVEVMVIDGHEDDAWCMWLRWMGTR